MYTLLSFSLSATTPTLGKSLEIVVDESLELGHVGNTFYYTTWNHAGTHIDAPAHMLAEGKPFTAFRIGEFIFDRPCLIDVPKEPNQLITSKDLRPYEDVIADSDLLLLRTGFTSYRRTEPIRYRDENPGLSVDVARYLGSTRFPQLRAVGIDAISMAAMAHLSEGVEAHKILFRREGGTSVFLIEDMDLTADLTGMQKVFVAPLFIEGLDSGPCTIIAEIDVDERHKGRAHGQSS